MLREYAFIPDIFDDTRYTERILCSHKLNEVRSLVLHEGIACNLRDGEWSKYLTANNQRFNKAGIELIKAVRLQSRMKKRPPVLPASPQNDIEWVNESVASHLQFPLDGVLVSHSSKQHYPGEDIVSSIEKLDNSAWWNNRPESVRLVRRTTDYLRVLKLLLQNSNSLMFIDPHLDVARDGYAQFSQILGAIERNNHNLNPKIEIHRACYIGSGPSKRIIPNNEWESSFKRILEPIVRPKGLKLKIFIWDDFHDRYLISNLMGILVPNGFDVTTDPNDITTWSRLSRSTADDVQREFDPASMKHNKMHVFEIA